MNVVARFFEWAYDFIKSSGVAINWLLTPLTVPDWLRYFGYVFVPQHFMNLLIDNLLFTPIELISIAGLTAFVGIALFKWLIS